MIAWLCTTEAAGAFGAGFTLLGLIAWDWILSAKRREEER